MRKRIILCINSLNVGGAEKNFTELCINLKIQHDLYVLIFDDSVTSLSEKLNLNSIEVLRIPNSKYGHLVTQLLLLRILIKIKPSFLVSFLFYSDIICTLPCLFSRTKHVISIRNNYFEQFGASFKNRMFMVFHSFTVINAFAIVTVTVGLKNIFIHRYSSINDKIKVIHNYVDHRQPVRVNTKKKSKTLSIGFAGRIESQKNLILLLNATNYLHQKDYSITLDIVGEGTERSLLENFIALYNLESIVKLHGFKNKPFDILEKIDVFVLPSLYEGFPNVVIEAMARKIVVLSSNCETGPSEIITHKLNGLLFENNNIDDLVKYLKLLINGDLNTDYIGANARNRSKDFTSTIMTKQYLEIFNDYS